MKQARTIFAANMGHCLFGQMGRLAGVGAIAAENVQVAERGQVLGNVATGCLFLARYRDAVTVVFKKKSMGSLSVVAMVRADQKPLVATEASPPKDKPSAPSQSFSPKTSRR